jgi:hypothetical protein
MKTQYNSAVRRLVGCKPEDYVRYCIWLEPFSDEYRKARVPTERKLIQTTVAKVKPWMTDEEVKSMLEEYGELGFDDLPGWLRKELKIRNLGWNVPKKQKMPNKDNPALAKRIAVCKRALSLGVASRSQIPKLLAVAERLKCYEQAQARANITKYVMRGKRIFASLYDQKITIKDALEHRVMNKELTIADYMAKYKGTNINLIT